MLSKVSIDQDRFREDFEELADFGATPDGGVDRPALSPAHLKARQWFLGKAESAGLETCIDGAGNHSAILRQPGAERTLLLGSHLDSVPNGGRFDGALGVAAALEVLRTVKEAGLQPPANLEAIDFTDEESRYIAYWGSRALTGQLQAGDLRDALDEREDLKVLISSAGLDQHEIVSCSRDPRDLVVYVELHIEQGPRLAQNGVDLGIVTSIAGIWSYRFDFLGRRDHAGTTPVTSRLDAGLGASSFALASHAMLLAEFPDCVANVGDMVFDPGAQNVVPGKVSVQYEFRCPDEKLGAAFEKNVRAKALDEALRFGLQLDTVLVGHSQSTQLDARIQEEIRTTVDAMGLSAMKIASGAGHDAQVMAGFTPSGLIFVPSVAGASHSPKESSRWQDCVNGANALLRLALKLAKG